MASLRQFTDLPRVRYHIETRNLDGSWGKAPKNLRFRQFRNAKLYRNTMLPPQRMNTRVVRVRITRTVVKGSKLSQA